jgi:transposase-like protein
MRKSYSGNLKAKMAIDMIREQETVAELSAKYEVHRSMLTKYKKEAIEGLPELLSKTKKNKNDQQNLIDKLYMKIGQLEIENDWLKKKVEAISC